MIYRELTAWQKAYKFVLSIYSVTKHFPKEELFGVVSQMRRAAASIPVNIAEGSMRQTPKEYHQFLYIARGSLTEIEVWLQLSRDLQYLPDEQFAALWEDCAEVGRLINGLLKAFQ